MIVAIQECLLVVLSRAENAPKRMPVPGITRVIAAEFTTGKASRGGLTLLIIIANLFVVSGPFVTDPNMRPNGACVKK